MKVTQGEIKVLEQLVLDKANKQIADALSVTEHAVKYHLHNLRRRFKATRVGLAVMWTKQTFSTEVKLDEATA